MPLHFLPKFCGYVITIAVLTVGVAFFWSVSDDHTIAAPLRVMARLCTYLLIVCCYMWYLGILRLVGGASLYAIRRHRSRRATEDLYQQSNELLLRAGLDPADPVFRMM
jgi:hypothetical protein